MKLQYFFYIQNLSKKYQQHYTFFFFFSVLSEELHHMPKTKNLYVCISPHNYQVYLKKAS